MSRVYSAEEKREMLKALSIQNAVNLTAVAEEGPSTRGDEIDAIIERVKKGSIK